jgi:hypothetical protein
MISVFYGITVVDFLDRFDVSSEVKTVPVVVTP